MTLLEAKKALIAGKKVKWNRWQGEGLAWVEMKGDKIYPAKGSGWGINHFFDQITDSSYKNGWVIVK